MKPLKICYIADMPHHYRKPIFDLMSNELGCDFYFGNKKSTVKHIDLNEFDGVKGTLSYLKVFGSVHFLVGSITKALRYETVVLLGDPHGLHNWLICLICRATGKSVVLWTHGWYGKESGIKAFLKVFLFRLASKIWVYGPRAKKLLVKKGISENKIDVVFNSLDYCSQCAVIGNEIDRPDCSKYFGNEFPIISYVGRVQPIKRLDLVIRALALLRDNSLTVNFLLVGSMEEDGEIQKLVSDLGLESQVLFYGPCYSEIALYNVFRCSSVCVSPGNVGLTAIHSLNYGCPVITHNDFNLQMPEFEAIVPGYTGDFFKIGDVESLAVNIKEWTQMTEERRSVVRDACRLEVSVKWNPESQLNVMRESLGI